MKRCPTCKKTFTDEHLSFCTDDGTPLLSFAASENTPEDETTVVRPSRGDSGSEPPGPSSNASEPRDVPPYQPPGSYIPPQYVAPGKRRTWPWLVGILAVVLLLFAGLGIAAVILIPNILRTASNNSRNLNANIQRSNSNPNLNERNSNLSSNSADQNEDDDLDDDDTTPPPTDQEAVLAELKNLEDEWTVANINADKKKLNRILADDYVGITEGRAQGKAEYLKTIERDNSIQRWEFQNLKVSLNGDRASLTGILRLEVKDERGQNQNLAFRFTDKFVWRDGRWQATGSEVTSLKEGTAA